MDRSRNDSDRLAQLRGRLTVSVVGDILDQLGRTQQCLPPGLRPVGTAERVLGRAMPVLTADVFGTQDRPFGRLTQALDDLRPDEVYVVRGGRSDCAAWGEILTAAARARSAAGAVIDGFHRDSRAVAASGWPVFSRGACARDSAVRATVLDYRVPIMIGTVQVMPGELVVGDPDGVVVVPREVEDEVVERALAKLDAENLVLRAIRDGMSTTDAFATYGVL